MRAPELAIIVLLAVLAIAAQARRERFGTGLERTVPVRSRVDGAAYRVVADLPDPRGAADRLAALNAKATCLLRSLRRRYGSPGAQPQTAPAGARRAAAHKLLSRFNPDNFAENSPRDASGDSSYCLDKGAVVAMCLRSRGPGRGAGGRAPPPDELHDPETLTFVMLHELAHIAVDDYDHPPEFWRTFKFLLAEAQLANCYRSPDFAAAPVDYCGVHVGYNPLYDAQLATI
jgi:hypothetical protein